MALNGKKDRARELKQQEEQSQVGKQEVPQKEEKEDEYLSSFLKMSGAIRVGE